MTHTKREQLIDEAMTAEEREQAAYWMQMQETLFGDLCRYLKYVHKSPLGDDGHVDSDMLSDTVGEMIENHGNAYYAFDGCTDGMINIYLEAKRRAHDIRDTVGQRVDAAELNPPRTS
jgi:hypothetical protein